MRQFRVPKNGNFKSLGTTDDTKDEFGHKKCTSRVRGPEYTTGQVQDLLVYFTQ